MEEDFSLGALLSKTMALARSNAVATFVAFAALVAVGTAFDYLRPDSLITPATLVQLIAQFVLTRIALDRLGLIQRQGAAVFAFIGLAIVSGIALMIGFILLIVPGVFMAIRWSASVPILLAEQQTIGASLSESRDRTEGRMLPIFLAMMVCALPLLAVFMIEVVNTGSMPVGPLVRALTENIALAAQQIAYIYLAVAIYLGVTDHGETLEDVFA